MTHSTRRAPLWMLLLSIYRHVLCTRSDQASHFYQCKSCPRVAQTSSIQNRQAWRPQGKCPWTSSTQIVCWHLRKHQNFLSFNLGRGNSYSRLLTIVAASPDVSFNQRNDTHTNRFFHLRSFPAMNNQVTSLESPGNTSIVILSLPVFSIYAFSSVCLSAIVLLFVSFESPFPIFIFSFLYYSCAVIFPNSCNFFWVN